MTEPSVGELRGQIRQWRRGRADTRLLQVLEDAYVAVFAAVMGLSVAVSVVLRLRNDLEAVCRTATCHQARSVLPLVLALAVLTGCVVLARLFGPMLVSPAVASWLLAAPVDRTRLLRPRLFVTALGAMVPGGVAVAGVAALAGYDAGSVAALGAAQGLLCVLVVGSLTVAQALRPGMATAVGRVLAAVTWGLLAGLTLGLLPRFASAEAGASVPAAVVVAVLVVAGLAAVALWRAADVLPLIPRDRLTPGGTLAPGLSGALGTLDLALAYDVLLGRHWQARSTVASRPARGTGIWPLVWRDLIRLRRRPRLLVLLAAAAVVPFLAAELGLERLVLPVAAITGLVAGLDLFSALRVLSRTPGLVRCLPQPGWQVRAACCLVPAVPLLVWGVATAPAMQAALGGPWAVALGTGATAGAAAVVGAMRWMTGRPPNYQLPLVSSPMGAVPPTLYLSVFRGIDVTVLVTVPVLVAPTVRGVEVALGLAAVIAAILLARD
ncbi:MAG TPA: DUF6297 family protein [Nocardioidaceae bacterium]|nr:DUF6297 family protein [Nocardioidaceae bacterium]